MTSLRELPELMDKRALGEIAQEMNLTLPMDGVKGDAELDQEDKEKAELEKNAESDSEEGTESAEIIDLHPSPSELTNEEEASSDHE